MPDRQGETGATEKRAKSADGKTLVNAWVATNPKATVEQGVVFFLLPLVASEVDLRSRANTLKITSADVDLILSMAKTANYPVGNFDSRLDQVGVFEADGRKVYYVLSRADERGDATLYTVTQGHTPQTTNTAVFYGPPAAFKNIQSFAKMFRPSAS